MRKGVVLAIVLMLCVMLSESSRALNRELKQKRVIGENAGLKSYEAEEAWGPFWRNFTKAIRNRDRASLKALISKNYRCQICSCDKADKREIFFCDTPGEWWKEFHFIFEKGTRIEKISRVEGETTRSVSHIYNPSGVSALFRYESDGRWYFIAMFEGGSA